MGVELLLGVVELDWVEVLVLVGTELVLDWVDVLVLVSMELLLD